MTTTKLAKLAIDAALDRKAKRLVLLDVKDHSNQCDLVFICSGDNNKQTQAIADSIVQRLKKDFDTPPFKTEGEKTGNWILLDYGEFTVHVFFDYLRDYYALEGLWPEANFLDIKEYTADAPQSR